jgi:transglutaminase-like putative cysteine protease
MPSDNERQTVRLVNEEELRNGRVTKDKKFGNHIYYRRFTGGFGEHSETSPKSQAPIHIELCYDVEFREYTVEAAKKLISTRQVTPGPEMSAYLGPTTMIPIEGRVSELAEQINLPPDEPLRAGRRIYDYLVETMKYNWKAPGAGQGNAVWACDSKTGDCSDFHSVFIGLCRWRGIPADHVFGLTIPPKVGEGTVDNYHCWAQFWVSGVGWIPIDASRANKFPIDREYYFGTLGNTWLTLTHGRDVVLEPPQQGAALNMFEVPYVEIDGQTSHAVRWYGHFKIRQ